MSETEPGSPARRGHGRVASFFFLRPTLGILLCLLLTAGGLLAYAGLVKEAMPDLAIPQATVRAHWPGADPQTMEQEVTEKLETELKTVRGVKTLSSASFDSFSLVAVEFEADAPLEESMQLLRTALDEAEAELPTDVEKPSVDQVSVDDRPILSAVLFGDFDAGVLSRAARDIEDRVERVAGVNELVIGGLREEVVRVRLRPTQLQGLGLSPTQVRDAIRAANVDLPWGELQSEEFGATLRLFGRFRSIDDLRRQPVARVSGAGGGSVVRLGEIAQVERGLERETTRAAFSWRGAPFEPSIEISIKKNPGSDTLEVIERVKQTLGDAQTRGDWPVGLQMRITQDQSEDIWNSLSNVLNNGWQAMLAVFLVLLVVLSWREGLVAGLSIPLTFLGALVIIWALGYSLNELVLIGMVLALGLLVDVFILMMEGMHEGIFVEGQDFRAAALSTVRRYAVPAAAGQLTTILALAPLMAISGTAGKFIRVLPVAAIACLAMSLVVALLIDIPLSRFVLGDVSPGDRKQTAADRVTAAASRRLQQWSVRVTLASRRSAALWVAGSVLIFIGSLALFTTVPMIMYPAADGRTLGVTVELPPATRLDRSQEVADRLGEILRSKPYLESVVRLVGQKSPFALGSLQESLSASEGENYVGFSCIFVPRADRDALAYVYTDRLRDELQRELDAHVAGATLLLVGDTGGPSAQDPVQVELVGDDMDLLRDLSQQVQTALREVPGTVDVRDNLGSLRSEIKLLPRREAIDFYDLSEQEIATQVRYALSEQEIGKFAVQGLSEDLPIHLGIGWPSRGDRPGGPTSLEELAMVRVFGPEGQAFPLLSLLRSEVGTAPVSITHKNALRSISVLAKTADRAASEIVAELEPKLEALQANWPGGYAYSFAGEAQETAETFGSAGAMLVIAIVLLFALLVLLFGSFLQSFIILATIPLALIGTFLGFGLLRIPFSFFAMVGIISLIGIVANDAIVMVDTMNRRLRSGDSVREAAAHGASDRLRPIITTSVTTIIGLIPLAISNPMWRPLCFAVIFGLIASTVLSLLIVPCFYLLLTRPKRHRAARMSPLTPHAIAEGGGVRP